MLFLSLFLAFTSSTLASAVKSESVVPPLPTVDLGYQLQRATVLNSTGQYYNFSNVRYARPPTGELRFKASEPPLEDRKQVFTGDIGRICPQSAPAWGLLTGPFITAYLQGKTHFEPSDFNTSAATSQVPAQDPRSTEDCLFLDVMVPRKIFDNRQKKKAPVLVWIHGGGYIESEKMGFGSAAGLIGRSVQNNGEGMVYVSLNYRLGAFGWLSGSTLQASGGTANAGLYDQLLALEWVQEQIEKFGGDPKRVTVMGESAGAGSIMHQITAFGGSKPVPFQQAILQSPAYQPLPSSAHQEAIFNAFLQLLNVSTIDQARSLPYEKLQMANILQVGASDFGLQTFGPVVDGIIAPQLPPQLLQKGQFAKNLKVMVGHNADEGLGFLSPFISNNTGVDKYLLGILPTLSGVPSVLKYITNVLYPPIFDGSQALGYTNQIARAAAIVGEGAVNCNTYFLDKAFNNQTYSYIFAVPPALHGIDPYYTFYNGPDPDNVKSLKVVNALQGYVSEFVECGEPNGKGVDFFPRYGSNATVQVLNVNGTELMRDDAANARCEFWQKALYY